MKILDKINYFRYYDYNHLYKEIRFWFWFSVVISLLVLMICRIIVLYVSFNTQSGGFLFTILNALVWYVYINALGVGNNGLKSNKLKWLVIVIAILLVLSGFGYFSIEFEFNFWFFNWTRLGLSSENGIWFFWLNTLIWFPLYFITFIVESEVSN